MSDDPQHPPASPQSNPWALALGAGTELVVSVLLGFFVGRWLDGKFATAPWLMLAGALIGISLGLYQLIRAAGRGLPRAPKRG